MAAGDDWGQGSVNNTNGFGKGAENNTISWGLIHGNSYGHPRTNLTGGGGFVGLLDDYPGAAAAYSLRLLRSDYSGGLVRVMAWNGLASQGEADIMPYQVGSDFVVDLNSTLENLDAIAIGRGLTTSDTLADLVLTGTSNYDGLTPTWYGQQSSSSINLIQPATANMPILVSSGTINTLNLKNSLVNGFMYSSARFDLSQPNSIFTVHRTSSISGIVIGSDPSGSDRTLIYTGPTGKTYFAGGTLRDAAYLGINNQYLESFIVNGVNSEVYSNGSLVISGNSGTNTIGDLAINAYNNGTFGSSGIQQELIVYPDNQSANRAAIETNINNFYNIYP